MKDTYTQVAITPFRDMRRKLIRYKVEKLALHLDTVLVKDGDYDTPIEALAAIELPLHQELHQKFLQMLLDGQKAIFSLEDSVLFD